MAGFSKRHTIRFAVCAAVLLALSLFRVTAVSASVPARPEPPRLVNDLAGIFSAEQVSGMEQFLEQFARQTSNQFAVVTVPELYGMDASMLAYSIGEQWGVGSSRFDNGLVILVKPKIGNERGQVFIAVGYGLEGAIPDALCKRVVEQQMIPHFRNDDYYSGVVAALNVLVPIAKGEYSVEEYMGKDSGVSVVGILFILVIVVLFILAATRGGGSQNMGGRGRRSPDALDMFLLGSMLGGSGRGRSGGFGGGGFGGGGFGGFGGGGFGGGGAGGSW